MRWTKAADSGDVLLLRQLVAPDVEHFVVDARDKPTVWHEVQPAELAAPGHGDHKPPRWERHGLGHPSGSCPHIGGREGDSVDLVLPGLVETLVVGLALVIGILRHGLVL